MDGHSRQACTGKMWGVEMAKIVFVEDAEQDAQEHEADTEAIVQLFKMAEQLSEAELERLARILSKFRPADMQPSP